MPDIIISHATTGKTLYSGIFGTLRACIEAAAVSGTDLSGADLRHANLGNADLDTICLKGARLDNANLAGANLSEARLEGSVFTNSALQNACLCFSMLTDCDFTGSQFGATDISGARLDGSRFSTLSAFSLNFIDANSLTDCRYLDQDTHDVCRFSKAPVVVNGLAHPIALLDDHIKIGGATIRITDYINRRPISASSARPGGMGLYPFAAAVRGPVGELLRYRGVMPALPCRSRAS